MNVSEADFALIGWIPRPPNSLNGEFRDIAPTFAPSSGEFLLTNLSYIGPEVISDTNKRQTQEVTFSPGSLPGLDRKHCLHQPAPELGGSRARGLSFFLT